MTVTENDLLSTHHRKKFSIFGVSGLFLYFLNPFTPHFLLFLAQSKGNAYLCKLINNDKK